MSTSLQAKNLCAADVQTISKKTVKTLKMMRCDEYFELFWKDEQNKAANLSIDSQKLPSKKRAPPRIEECLGGYTAPEFDEDIISYYRKTYYEALDCITNVVTDHSDQQDLRIYIKLEKLLIKAAKGDDFHAECDDDSSIYCKDFDDNQFQVQMETFSEYCKELVIISVCTIAQKQLHGSHRVSKIDFGDASDKLNI